VKSVQSLETTLKQVEQANQFLGRIKSNIDSIQKIHQCSIETISELTKNLHLIGITGQDSEKLLIEINEIMDKIAKQRAPYSDNKYIDEVRNMRSDITAEKLDTIASIDKNSDEAFKIIHDLFMQISEKSRSVMIQTSKSIQEKCTQSVDTMSDITRTADVIPLIAKAGEIIEFENDAKERSQIIATIRNMKTMSEQVEQASLFLGRIKSNTDSIQEMYQCSIETISELSKNLHLIGITGQDSEHLLLEVNEIIAKIAKQIAPYSDNKYVHEVRSMRRNITTDRLATIASIDKNSAETFKIVHDLFMQINERSRSVMIQTSKSIQEKCIQSVGAISDITRKADVISLMAKAGELIEFENDEKERSQIIATIKAKAAAEARGVVTPASTITTRHLVVEEKKSSEERQIDRGAAASEAALAQQEHLTGQRREADSQALATSIAPVTKATSTSVHEDDHIGRKSQRP